MRIDDLHSNNVLHRYFISKHMLNDSSSFLKSLVMPKRLVVYGRGASGKDTIKQRFRDNGIRCDVSVTTRPKRPHETNHIEYEFVSDDAFDMHIMNNEIKYYVDIKSSTGNWRYGTTKESWDKGGVFIATPNVVNAQSGWLTKKEKRETVFLLLDIPRSISIDRLVARNDKSNTAISRIKFDDGMYGNDKIKLDHYNMIVNNHKF